MKNVYPYSVRFEHVESERNGFLYLFDEAAKLPLVYERMTEGIHSVLRLKAIDLQWFIVDHLERQPDLFARMQEHLSIHPFSAYDLSVSPVPGMALRDEGSYLNDYFEHLALFLIDHVSFSPSEATPGAVERRFVETGQTFIESYQDSIYDGTLLSPESSKVKIDFFPDFDKGFDRLKQVAPVVHDFLDSHGVIQSFADDFTKHLAITVYFNENQRVETF